MLEHEQLIPRPGLKTFRGVCKLLKSDLLVTIHSNDLHFKLNSSPVSKWWMFLECLGRKDGQCLQVFSSVFITAKAKNGPESVLVNQRWTHQLGQKEGLYLLLTNVSCCPISGCHSNVTLEALSHGSDGYGVMLAHCTHTWCSGHHRINIYSAHPQPICWVQNEPWNSCRKASAQR